MSESLKFINTVTLFPFGVKIILHSGCGNREAQVTSGDREGERYGQQAFPCTAASNGRFFPAAIIHTRLLRLSGELCIKPNRVIFQ